MLLTSTGIANATTVPGSEAPEIAGPVDAGYRDFSFGSATLATPTGEKPQSKLWWNDGSWWGCLWDPNAGAHRIHRFDKASQTWTSVGPNADNRLNTLVDVLWDGTRLYIISHIFNSSGEFRLHSYTYDSVTGTYTLRSGFPAVLGSGNAEALTVAKDTTGKLWITWEQSNHILVNRSTTSETTWGTSFQLPVQGNDVSSDDISGVIAFGSKVGIMWSNQSDKKMYFATHLDGAADTTWLPREEALANATLGAVADDHLNMALTSSTNPPTIFAVTKTSLSGASTLPQIYLLRREPSGVWTSYVAGDQDDDHTRAIVQIDDENRKIYVIARSNDGDNAIRIKVTDLDAPAFVPGSGTAFIQSLANPEINNVSATKQTLNGTTDLLAIASDEVSRFYFHNTLDLPSAPAPQDISVSPALLAYGDVLVGGNLAHTFVVQNDGGTTLQVTATTLTGTDAAQFSITSGGGAFNLAPGGTHNVAVTFTPASLGAKSATFRVASNDPNENPFDVPLSGIGVLPEIVIAPAAFDYGNVGVGTPAAHAFMVRNAGTSALAVTVTGVTGTNAADFAITQGGGSFSVAPGDSHAVAVTFTPQAAGARSAALQLTSDDADEASVDVPLTGTGVQPNIVIVPMAHDFGVVAVGDSVLHSFMVHNQGGAELSVTASNFQGKDANEFAVTSGGAPFVVAAGDSHTIVVACIPDHADDKSARLRITSNDPEDSSITVELDATAIDAHPDIDVQPLALNFPSLAVNDSAESQVVVHNTGNALLHVTGAWLAGPDSTSFGVITPPPFDVAPSDSMALGIRFAPSTDGGKVATLHIESADPDESPVLVAVSGTALALVPDLDAPSTGAFGLVALGALDSLTLTIGNTGTTTLHVLAPTVLGPDSLDFIVFTGGAFTVAPNATAALRIGFTPHEVGSRHATLRLESDDPDENPWTIALQGTCGIPDLVVAPATHAFGNVGVGSSASKTFQLTNQGTVPLHVTATACTGANADAFTITGGGGAFVLLPGAERDLAVSFLPTTTGPKGAVVVIASDDPGAPNTGIALSGSGAAAPTGSSAPLFVESTSGSSADTTTVSTSSSLAAATGQLYLAFVSMHALVDVTGVEGMGLTWSRVATQCAANQASGVEVWRGQGSPVSGTITAAFASAPTTAAIVVSRYSGTDTSFPIAASTSANTLGIAGACVGGASSASYSLPVVTSADAAVVVAAVATASGALTPGASWTQRSAVQTGSGANACGVAMLDRTVPTVASLDVDGTFDMPVDWAVVVLEIRHLDATTDVAPDPTASEADRVALHVRGGKSLGRGPEIEVTLPQATLARITLHDVRGKRLRTLWQGTLPAGHSAIPWGETSPRSNLPSGVYFVRADLGDRVVSGKVLLIH